MKKTILLIAAVILAVFAVVGAGCIGADPIVGEWKAGNMPVTFNEDGTGSFTVTLPILGTFNYDLRKKYDVQQAVVRRIIEYEFSNNEKEDKE